MSPDKVIILIKILLGFALLFAGLGITGCISFYQYGIENNKDIAGLYYFLGAVSMVPLAIYLLILVKH